MTRRPPVDRRELLLAVSVAVVLVLGRSIVPTLNEQLDFDSDQAIVGLMAKHLSEFRAFPLFFYGQHYMLGVQSWIAVPFFWIGGPTVAMLRLPLVIINAAVATIVIIAFARLGMRPLFAFVATLPLIVTTPVISSALVETLGAGIEPFLYILVLWALRNRPAPFGAALCIACLHREFTFFALPAAIVAQCREHRDGRFLAFAKGAGAFAAVWILVDVLKQHASMLGPSDGSSETGSLLREAETISRWLSFRGDEYVARLRSLCTHGLPDLFGASTYRLLRYNVNSTLEAGSRFAGTALAVAAVVCLCRLLWHARDATRRNDFSRTSFALYLGLIAIQTIAAYGLNGGIDPAAPAVLRYVLFALLLPVSLFGAYFLVEATSTWRVAAAGLVGVWAVLTLQDNLRLAQEYRVTPPTSQFRVLADYLVAHRIKYGRAGYWDCYIVDFLSRERVILASTQKVRVSAYQARVELNQANAVTVRRMPCDEGARVASWCITDPLNR